MKSNQKQVNVSNEQDGAVHADRTHVENTLQQQRQKTTVQPGWIWGSGALGEDSSPSKGGSKKGGSGKNKPLKGNKGKSNGAEDLGEQTNPTEQVKSRIQELGMTDALFEESCRKVSR